MTVISKHSGIFTPEYFEKTYLFNPLYQMIHDFTHFDIAFIYNIPCKGSTFPFTLSEL